MHAVKREVHPKSQRHVAEECFAEVLLGKAGQANAEAEPQRLTCMHEILVACGIEGRLAAKQSQSGMHL